MAHSLGLETFYLIVQEIRGRHSPVEREKKVIHRGLGPACYSALLHVLPVGASVTLVVFNWRGYYIGGELSGAIGMHSLKLLGLQFAAKMLELLAMASLTTILFAFLRNRLMFDFLPFGAMTAGFEFSKLSMLWSKEFVATCAATFSTPSKKIFLITIIIIFTILGATIGPSAAVASQPVLRNWDAGGTVFWLNVNSQDLWPSLLNESRMPDLHCSSGDISCYPPSYSLLASQLLSFWPASDFSSVQTGTKSTVPEKAWLSGRHSRSAMAVRFRGPFVYEPELTVATAPSTAITDAVSEIQTYWFGANAHLCDEGKARFCYYNDIFYQVKATQPISYVKCEASNVNTTIRFPRVDQGDRDFPLIEYNSTIIGTQDWLEKSVGNEASPVLSWVDLPEGQFGRSSIGAVIALPKTNTSGNPSQVIACTVDARWAKATATSSFLDGPMSAAGIPDNWIIGDRLAIKSDGQPKWPQVRISTDWAEAINPTTTEPPSSAFASLCNSVGGFDDIQKAPDTVSAVESILALMITDQLARLGNTATILGSLKSSPENQWMDEILPKGSVFGKGGSAFDYEPKEGDQVTEFTSAVTVNGYGYGISTASLLSTLVLVVYSLIAVLYVVHTICFAKTTSSSWDSITELIALAFNSMPSSAIQNTGAGIATLKTLKEPVRIGVSDNCLQMVFEDRKDFDLITPDETYG